VKARSIEGACAGEADANPESGDAITTNNNEEAASKAKRALLFLVNNPVAQKRRSDLSVYKSKKQ